MSGSISIHVEKILTGDAVGRLVGSRVLNSVSGFTKTDMLVGQVIEFIRNTLLGSRSSTTLMSTIPVLQDMLWHSQIRLKLVPAYTGIQMKIKYLRFAITCSNCINLSIWHHSYNGSRIVIANSIYTPISSPLDIIRIGYFHI